MSNLIDDIKDGKVVILPTDTLHALSCDATNDVAVKKLIAIKGRKENHPLPILVKDLEQAMQYGEFNEQAASLAKKYWPGALTLVVPIKPSTKLSPLIFGNFNSIAMRVAKSDILTQVLSEINVPLVGTSANISGQENLLTDIELKEKFGDKVNTIVFADNLLAVPSTIIDCTGSDLKLIRAGAIRI